MSNPNVTPLIAENSINLALVKFFRVAEDGFDGGGQFAQAYAMLASSLVIANSIDGLAGAIRAGQSKEDG